jgi:hypothetical protein
VGNLAASFTSASEDCSGLSLRGMPTTSRHTTHLGKCRLQLGQLTPAPTIFSVKGLLCGSAPRPTTGPGRGEVAPLAALEPLAVPMLLGLLLAIAGKGKLEVLEDVWYC